MQNHKLKISVNQDFNLRLSNKNLTKIYKSKSKFKAF